MDLDCRPPAGAVGAEIRDINLAQPLHDAASSTVENEHPVVRRHPDTGRRSLYVNRGFTKCFAEMGEVESLPLRTAQEFCRPGTWRSITVTLRLFGGLVEPRGVEPLTS